MKEKHAVLLLLGLAVAGHGVRFLVSGPSDPTRPPGELLADSGPPSDPAAQRARAIRLDRPLRPGEKIDLNTASEEEIARLPRIGMSLAKRIVAFRSARGPFGSLADLERVAGVGPALSQQIRDMVRFSGVVFRAQGPDRRDPSQPDPGTYAVGAQRVNLNSASQSELERLPGIGPARARAILAYRRAKGPFAVVSDLRAVPGLTRKLVEQLGPLVTTK